MATINGSNIQASSITFQKNQTGSGTITWTNPTLPAGAVITKRILSGSFTGPRQASITVNGDTFSLAGNSTTYNFSVEITSENTTSVNTSATGKNAGTVSFSNLVYTVTYEVPLVLKSISLNNTSITVEKNKTKTITVIPNPSECLLSDLQWSTNNNNCKIYPNPAGYDESTNRQTGYGLNCEILGYEVGTSIITVTTSDGTKSASCTVTVVESTNDDIEIIWDHGHVLSETGEIVLKIGDEYVYTHMIHVDPINKYYVTITNQKGAYLAGYSYDSNCNYIGRLAQSNGDYFADDAVNEAINLPDNASYIRFRVTCGADDSHRALIESQDKITINVNIKHTVIFKDWDGTTLKTETVEESASATAPSNPVRKGYIFTGWDKDFTNVTSDLTVTAQYEEIKSKTLVAKYTANTAGVVPTFNSGYTYEVSETENNGIYTVEIFSDSDFSSIRFASIAGLLTVEYLKITNAVTRTYQLFYSCTSLTSINGMSDWDTSNVTSMYSMFHKCQSLTTIDLSSFDTSNVVYMNNMFYKCNKLTQLDLSSFDTSSVTEMSWMFEDCNNLTSLNLSNFNTNNVNNTQGMFSNCAKLTELDLSNFNTSNVESMYCMFYGCQSLTSLNLSNFNTNNVTDMVDMFYACNNLASISMNNSDYNSINKVIAQLPTRTTSSMGTLNIAGVDDFSRVNITTAQSKFWNVVEESEEPEIPDDNFLVQGDINEDGSFNDGVSTVVRTKYIDISDKKSIVVNVLTDNVYISACYLYNANKELVKVIEIPAGKKRMFGVNLQELIAQMLNDEGSDQ